MSGDPTAVRIEPCIKRRLKGTYVVQVTKNYQWYHDTFPTLKEARKYRDMIRKGRVPIKGGSLHKAYQRGDEAAEARERKKVIAQARKQAKTVVRDGREYKLVKL